MINFCLFFALSFLCNPSKVVLFKIAACNCDNSGLFWCRNTSRRAVKTSRPTLGYPCCKTLLIPPESWDQKVLSLNFLFEEKSSNIFIFSFSVDWNNKSCFKYKIICLHPLVLNRKFTDTCGIKKDKWKMKWHKKFMAALIPPKGLLMFKS